MEKQSLRYFLNHLESCEILDFLLAREDYILSGIVQELDKKKLHPVIRLTDPLTGAQCVANLFADRDIIRKFIHNIDDDIEKKASDFTGLEFVTDAPAQEVVVSGENVNILELPIFKHFEADAGRYITSGVVIARDPKTGRCNFSFHRMQLKGPNRIGISMHSRGDLWQFYNEAASYGKDLEIAVMIGNHPAYYIAGATKIPSTQDDYSWAAAFMNEKAKVTWATSVSIPVPAYAEYIIEGRISATEYEDEGPFAEYTGYSTSKSTRNVFLITAITHRTKPIYQDLVPGLSTEHLLLSQFTKEALLLQKLRIEIPGVKALNIPKNGCHFHAYVSMNVCSKGQAKQVALLLFGLDAYLKLVIVVDDDIDAFNEEEVMWAVATHVQADRDVFIVPDVICNKLDPSSKGGMSAKMGIDATSEPGKKEKRSSLPYKVIEKAKMILGGID